MTNKGRILLVTGPAGSGKSTLAERVSSGMHWQYVGEDEYWVKNGWASGLRSEEQEGVVQKQVLSDILPICKMGRSAVLEFILYKSPPNPLTSYMEALTRASIDYDVVALKPTIDEILKRLEKRGRSYDLQDQEENRRNAENQLGCLEESYIKTDWIIDPTNITEDALADLVIQRLTE